MLNTLQKLFVTEALKGANILLTGEAGTGKSFALKELIQQFGHRKQVVAVTATTGVAALNVGGSTFHSWLGAGLAEEDVWTLIAKIKKNKKAASRIKRTKTLIIDEISMMDPELFEKFDKICKTLRGNQRPFGGLQVVAVGDFYQLRPVKSGMFCFETQQWSDGNFHIVQLQEQVRQDSTTEFAKALARIRVGQHTKEDEKLIKSRKGHKWDGKGIEPVRLYCKNKDVEKFNLQRLLEVEGRDFYYYAEDSGRENYSKFFDRNCPAPSVLRLRVGAQVMLLQNIDVEGGLVNGSLGTVVSCGPANVVVNFSNGVEEVLSEYAWEAKEQVAGPGGEIKMKKVASRKQIPLKLAYATTVHKAQGQTLDRVEVDLTEAFDDGMVYVALSRVRDLDSLSVIGVDFDKVRVNKKCLEFYG